MSVLHEILAAEKTKSQTLSTLFTETMKKFQKPDSYLTGLDTTLSMIESNEENAALEQASREEKPLTTTVVETMDYLMGFWADNENLQFKKNLTNTQAVVELTINGTTFHQVPVDELLGLESRLTQLRGLITQAPTLTAGAKVEPDTTNANRGAWKEEPTVKTKISRAIVPLVLFPATEKHPAQVKEVSEERIVGKFTTTKFYGHLTSLQKANLLAAIDSLLVEVKQARIRANNVEVVNPGNIGEAIKGLLMGTITG